MIAYDYNSKMALDEILCHETMKLWFLYKSVESYHTQWLSRILCYDHNILKTHKTF